MATKVEVIYRGKPPAGAPGVMWVNDNLTLAQLCDAVPGAVGFAELDWKPLVSWDDCHLG